MAESSEPEPGAVGETDEVDEITPVAVGTFVWALLFVIGLVIRGDLRSDGRQWWIWSAATGVVLGLLGYLILSRRQKRLQAAAVAGRQAQT